MPVRGWGTYVPELPPKSTPMGSADATLQKGDSILQSLVGVGKPSM